MSLVDSIRSFIGKVVGRLLPTKEIERELKVKTSISGIMQDSISLWADMYANLPPWSSETKCLNLPATISSEFARLILTEYSFEVTGSPMADYINTQIQRVLNPLHIEKHVELWAALGGIALKPYIQDMDEDGAVEIAVDVHQADDFYPLRFDSNGILTSAVFMETIRRGDMVYTRLEEHTLDGNLYTVINKAYEAKIYEGMQETEISANRFQKEIPLTEVEEWSALQPEVEIQNVKTPLFVYLKTPLANNVDKDSPLGAAVFHRAVEAIEEADKKWGNVIWEYKSKKAKIFADDSLFTTNQYGEPILSLEDQDLFRTFHSGGGIDAPMEQLIHEYSPEIRDTSLFNGLNEDLMQIEKLVGLAIGTISHPQDVQKTATEINSSKKRSYHTVSLMQVALEEALKQLVEVMRTYALLYGIVPDGKIDVTCSWGDGVLEDVELEAARRWSWVMAGYYKPEKFFAWYMGCSEEEALELIPPEKLKPAESFPDENE